MTSSDAAQAQIQGFELSHPNIYPIHELPGCMKGLLLHNYRIFIMHINNNISKRSSSEVPGSIESRKPGVSYQTSEPLQ